MNNQTKIILFSLVLLISIFNKQCTSISTYSNNTAADSESIDYSTPTEINNDYSSDELNVFLPTARPINGFSPYNSYCGKGIYDNSTDNTIKVTAPL